MSVKPRYVLLDRDGVINCDSDDYIKSVAEWQPIEGSLEGIALLNQQGYQIVVITNQSGIGRGFYSHETLEQMHAKMRRLLAEKGGSIAAIYYCPHLPGDHCDCRKPKPGMLHAFSNATGADFAGTYFVGDTWNDVATALAVNAIPLLVKTGKGMRTIAEHPEMNIPIFENLYAAAEYIIAHQNI